jgi:nucleotide-binding universal stress UspA family protein
MAERVVVAVDGGLASKAALDWAILRTHSAHVSLEIVTVTAIDSDFPGGPESDYRTTFEDALYDASERARAATAGTPINARLLPGLPHEAIIEATRNADLLVLGSNAASALAGVMHGTLSLKIAGRAACTVVVVPVNWAPRRGPVIAGWTDHPIADRALDVAAREAERAHKDLHIVHAWSMPTAIPLEGEPTEEMLSREERAHRTLLADAAQRIRNEHPDLTVIEQLQPDDAAAAIVDAASHASLTVVGSHGRGAIASLLLGSVSHAVLLALRAPVAVVPRDTQSLSVYPEILDEDLV